MSEQKQNTFEVLSAINVNDHIKQKMGLKYLSWSDAWKILKKNYPNAFSTTYVREVNTTETTVVKDNITNSEKTIVSTSTNEIPYFTDGNTAYVKVGVTVEGVEHIELYPIMNLKNAAMPLSLVTMTEVNKSIQRAFVKACARHGLGLYIYSGEDLPDSEKVVINYAAIEQEALGMAAGSISADLFEELRKSVSEKLQAQWPQDISEAIMGFAGAQLKGKRVSTLSPSSNEDGMTLARILKYISLIEEKL